MIARTLAGAGFRDIAIERVDEVARSESAFHFAAGLVRGNPVSMAIEERGGATFTEIEAAMGSALAAEGGSAPYRGPMRALVVSAKH